VRRPAFVVLVVAAGVALLVGLFFVFRGGSETGSGTGSRLEVTVRDAKPVGGIQDLTVDKGAQVVVHVDSDVADEVHVHGYDLMKDVAAGGSVEFDFPAKIDGKFEIELESRKEQIADLAVSP
jgi:hypothetical protein